MPAQARCNAEQSYFEDVEIDEFEGVFEEDIDKVPKQTDLDLAMRKAFVNQQLACLLMELEDSDSE